MHLQREIGWYVFGFACVVWSTVVRPGRILTSNWSANPFVLVAGLVNNDELRRLLSKTSKLTCLSLQTENVTGFGHLQLRASCASTNRWSDTPCLIKPYIVQQILLHCEVKYTDGCYHVLDQKTVWTMPNSSSIVVSLASMVFESLSGQLNLPVKSRLLLVVERMFVSKSANLSKKTAFSSFLGGRYMFAMINEEAPDRMFTSCTSI